MFINLVILFLFVIIFVLITYIFFNNASKNNGWTKIKSTFKIHKIFEMKIEAERKNNDKSNN